MCGIVGILGQHEVAPTLVEALKRLEYRGYDSAGIAIVDQSGQLQFRKTVGKVNGLTSSGHEDVPQGCLGLGHTRWAAHGKPTYSNAHPHTDCHQRIAVVHNGIVENFLALKQELLSNGHKFVSETDTEVITHLIEEGIDQGNSFEDAFLRMGRIVEGSQTVTATFLGEAGKICALRLGHAGGIVVAHRDGQGIIGSDLPAMLPLLRQEPQAGQGPGFLTATPRYCKEGAKPRTDIEHRTGHPPHRNPVSRRQ